MRRILVLIAAIPIGYSGFAQAAGRTKLLETAFEVGGKAVTVLVERKADLSISILGAAIYDAGKSMLYGANGKPEPNPPIGLPKPQGCNPFDDASIKCGNGLYVHKWVKEEPSGSALAPAWGPTQPSIWGDQRKNTFHQLSSPGLQRNLTPQEISSAFSLLQIPTTFARTPNHVLARRIQRSEMEDRQEKFPDRLSPTENRALQDAFAKAFANGKIDAP
jgi:hypothetical protein